MDKTSKNLEINGKTLTLETGQLAKQATSSVLAKLGDTMVLVTVVEGGERPDLGYFPLSVEYVERLYAGGRIKGSRWVKREGRPSDDAILTARLIDRSIRPLFPKEYKREVQIVVTVLSVDGENEPDTLSIVATSAALAISPIPWRGPIGAVRVGFVKDNGNTEFLINPITSEIALSELDIVVSQTKEKTLMLESGALQVSEEVVLSAIEKAQEKNKEIIKFIEDLASEVGVKKHEVSKDAKFWELCARIEKTYKSEITALSDTLTVKESMGDAINSLAEKIFEEEKLSDSASTIDKKIAAKAIEYIFFQSIREDVLKKGKRPDGRKINEVRPISCSVSVLPRTHGSAIFQRGNTQALTVVTLGSPRLEQLIESAGGEESKRYIHHYSMPPYSVGETGRMGVPSRREIGHGSLAERAIMPVIPSQDKFPYTIRVVSEILSSNGSTSMASTCGSTLSLMDAGVPIAKPVAGVAIGMMSKDENYVLLTDILGLEDFSGDMDFKVAGTDSGITAIQLDVKIAGLTQKQIEETLVRAKTAREFILDKMLKVLPQVREKLSEYAPKVELIHIPVEKIGEVIGPGGRVIKAIIAQTGAEVNVEDDGSVTVSGISEETVKKAAEWIKGLIREVAPGEAFEGEVKRILPFGAFVEFLPGREGMVHVSKMASGFVKNPNDVVSIGQKVKVRVVEIDDQGRVNLSMVFGDEGEKGSEGQGESGRPFRSDRRPFREPSGPGAEGPQKEMHPLSRQLRRERGEQWRSKSSGRRGSFGGNRSGSGFRSS